MSAALPLSITDASAIANYRVIPRAGTASLLEENDAVTNVWAYNDTVPGPTIRVQKGKPVKIEVINQLEQPTTIHWHGIRIDNSMDGVANLTQEPIPPGNSFIYRFTPPDAGTFWYHPHNRTWEQLARGLYGSLIVEGDSVSGEFDRDYTIVADDWRLQQNGLIHEESFGSLHDWSHTGRLGNILTLNGKPYENLDVVADERIRLRFINTSNARTMRFAIDRHQPWIVALDGQPVPPIKTQADGVSIAPAQRVDLIVDVHGKAGNKITIVETSGAERLVAGYLNCKEGKTNGRKSTPPHLAANTVAEPDLTSATDLELVMSGGAMHFLASANFKGNEIDGRTLARQHKQLWAFNGQAGMSEDPMFAAKLGETIKLKLINETAWPHAIHIHGHHFRILNRQAIQAQEKPVNLKEEAQSFRDTILVSPDEVAEIAFMADNPGK